MPEFAGRLSSTGHSKGGALASASALSGNFTAKTFNAAALSQGTADALRIDLSQARSAITIYSEPGEILSRLVNRIPFAPGNNGDSVMLSEPYNVNWFGVTRHLMSDVIKSINDDIRKNGCQ